MQNLWEFQLIAVIKSDISSNFHRNFKVRIQKKEHQKSDTDKLHFVLCLFVLWNDQTGKKSLRRKKTDKWKKLTSEKKLNKLSWPFSSHTQFFWTYFLCVRLLIMDFINIPSPFSSFKCHSKKKLCKFFGQFLLTLELRFPLSLNSGFCPENIYLSLKSMINFEDRQKNCPFS